MAVTSLGSYGGQNLMLMRNDNNADTLVAMLGSCSPHMSLQQVVSRSMGGLEDMSGCGQKRPYYAAYNDGPSVEEQEDVDEGADEFSHHVEKKRRLSFDQVRSLERNFEVENKLEPERKMQLAKELGLQPRQVAVWFQNRRARWKIKQLERDFEALTQDYNRLKSDFEVINRDKSKLKAEVNRLKGVPTTAEDVKALDSTQYRSETTSHPASPTQSEKSDIDSSRHSPRTAPTIDVPPATKEGTPVGMQRTMSSDSNSSDVMDADSPRTSDNSSSRTINTTTTTTTTNNINNNQSSPQQPPEQLTDVDGPWSQYPHFPPENFVGPNLQELCSVPTDQDLALTSHAFHRTGVKLEDMHSGFPTDQAFLLSRLEEQTVLPNWWDWA